MCDHVHGDWVQALPGSAKCAATLCACGICGAVFVVAWTASGPRGTAKQVGHMAGLLAILQPEKEV